jgi:hypothetical protein
MNEICSNFGVLAHERAKQLDGVVAASASNECLLILGSMNHHRDKRAVARHMWFF